MSEGQRPDLQKSRHSFAEFRLRLRAKARASTKGRNLRRPVAILPVPSQSPIPAQPFFAYVLSGLMGISLGRFSDLAKSNHSSRDFKPKVRTNARACSNGRYLTL